MPASLCCCQGSLRTPLRCKRLRCRHHIPPRQPPTKVMSDTSQAPFTFTGLPKRVQPGTTSALLPRGWRSTDEIIKRASPELTQCSISLRRHLQPSPSNSTPLQDPFYSPHLLVAVFASGAEEFYQPPCAPRNTCWKMKPGRGAVQSPGGRGGRTSGKGLKESTFLLGKAPEVEGQPAGQKTGSRREGKKGGPRAAARLSPDKRRAGGERPWFPLGGGGGEPILRY